MWNIQNTIRHQSEATAANDDDDDREEEKKHTKLREFYFESRDTCLCGQFILSS